MRLSDSFAAIDYFERRGLPFTVAVNCFDGADRYPPESVRDALDLDPQVPVMLCDARLKDDARDVLVSVVEHAMEAGARRREPALP